MDTWVASYLAAAAVVPPLVVLPAARRTPALVTTLRATVAAVVVWALLMAAMLHVTQAENASYEARVAWGEEVTVDEALSDGTGDNAGVLMLGWVPGVAYAGLLWALARRGGGRRGAGS